MDNYRRLLLKLVCTSPFLGVVNVSSSELNFVDLSKLNIYVPVFLFGEKAKGNSKALSIKRTESSKFVITFSGARQIRLMGATSVNSIVRYDKNRDSKRSMLLKRVFAFALQKVFLHVANKRHAVNGVSLRRNFEALQREEIINVVTIESMFNVLSQLYSLSMVSGILWDTRQSKFIVE